MKGTRIRGCDMQTWGWRHIPICHRELGPATEYGRRLAVIPLHLNAVLIGSVMRIADRILDLDTWYPAQWIRAITRDSPIVGNSSLTWLTKLRSSLSSIDLKISESLMPNSLRLLTRDTPNSCAIWVQEKFSERRWSNYSWETTAQGRPRPSIILGTRYPASGAALTLFWTASISTCQRRWRPWQRFLTTCMELWSSRRSSWPSRDEI